MKISYNWLKQYVETDLSPEMIAEILTSTGLETEGIEKIESVRGGLEGVVVGEVLTCEKHPDADRLSITTVDLGQGEPVQIVCGAPNVASGQKVLVATVGTVLYPHGETEGLKIKKSKIRGAESFGMICAEDELGIGESHEGIMVLDEDTIPGTTAREYLDIEDDYVFEIGLTPNRADAASHYGVARELAAYLKSHGKAARITLPGAEGLKKESNKGKNISVRVEDLRGCPRYMGVTISNVKVAPSPAWLQNRLRSIGLNPKNNVVDITNYILHSVGQPLHAFDAGKIEGDAIVVRTCEPGTPFVTLDGVERTLTANDLMICSAERPMCLAGIFGGLDSGVTEETTDVFIESAYFDPVTVRKSARHHGLNTDSSFRFERGIDPNLTEYALRRAAVLIKIMAGGEITSDFIDIYPEKIKPFPVKVAYKNITRLVGKEIPRELIKAILTALEIEIVRETTGELDLEVPPYRVDVRREADVIEEILRIYGYNNVEIPQHVNSTLSYVDKPTRDDVTRMIAEFLTANGFHEIMSNSLTRSAYYEGNPDYPAENCVKILNPLSNELNVMRQTLLYNALEAAQMNTNRKNGDLKLYEFGNCYFYRPDEAGHGLKAYREEYRLAILMTGWKNAPSWNTGKEQTDFFLLKSYAERILKRFGLDLYDAEAVAVESGLYREAVGFSYKANLFFTIGILSAKLRGSFDLKNDVFYLEMNVNRLMKLIRNHRVAVKELSNYPEVRRDLALLVDRQVTFAQLRKIAFGAEKKLLKNVVLFDVYEGDKLPEGKKSYALGFTLQDREKTMTDQAIDKIMEKIAAQLDKQAGATIRS